MSEEFEVTTADMLEIVAGGGNGVEYIDVNGLIEKAAKELREKDARIAELDTRERQLEEMFLNWHDEARKGYARIAELEAALRDAEAFISACIERPHINPKWVLPERYPEVVLAVIRAALNGEKG
jgi:predicted nuclease with TOPRIM domain